MYYDSRKNDDQDPEEITPYNSELIYKEKEKNPDKEIDDGSSTNNYDSEDYFINLTAERLFMGLI